MEIPKPYSIKDESIIKIPRFAEDAGFYTTKARSKNMSKIRSKNTKVELQLRSALWKLGYRYRLHSNKIIGKPDLIFGKQKLTVFVDGNFWHGYEWEKKKHKISANKAYWIPKIERNMQRDKKVTAALEQAGWQVLRFWDHEVKKDVTGCVLKISEALNRHKQ